MTGAGAQIASLTLRTPGASAALSPEGGRLTSLRVGGTELLGGDTAQPGDPPGFYQGCFPLAPFAGLLDKAAIGVPALDAALPANTPRGPEHGLVFDVPWRALAGDDTGADLAAELDSRWPWRGEVRLSARLRRDALRLELSLLAREAMPAALGFHPWFRRDLGGGPAHLDIHPQGGYPFSPVGMVTSKRGPLPPRPWDDVLWGVREAPILRWPGLELTLRSSAADWIVFERPTVALCVEPITAPAGALADREFWLAAGDSLSLHLELAWREGGTVTA